MYEILSDDQARERLAILIAGNCAQADAPGEPVDARDFHDVRAVLKELAAHSRRGVRIDEKVAENVLIVLCRQKANGGRGPSRPGQRRSAEQHETVG